MSRVYFGYDPPHEDLGKFCPICGREHFSEGDLCPKCKDRYTDDEEGE